MSHTKLTRNCVRSEESAAVFLRTGAFRWRHPVLYCLRKHPLTATGVSRLQHFSTALRESPPNFDVSDANWFSIPEITSFTFPDDFSGSKRNDTVLKLILKRRVSLVSEWVITRRDALVRLRYAPSGSEPIWEDEFDYSSVFQADPRDLPFIYTYVVPISVLWYTGDGRYDVHIDHVLP